MSGSEAGRRLDEAKRYDHLKEQGGQRRPGLGDRRAGCNRSEGVEGAGLFPSAIISLQPDDQLAKNALWGHSLDKKVTASRGRMAGGC